MGSKPPLVERAIAAAVGAASPPWADIVKQLDRLNDSLERYLQHTGIPEIDKAVIDLLDKPLPPPREDWEVAVDEEIAERRAASDREIKNEESTDR